VRTGKGTGGGIQRDFEKISIEKMGEIKETFGGRAASEAKQGGAGKI